MRSFLSFELLSIHLAGFCHLMGPFPYLEEVLRYLPIVKHWDVGILSGLALPVFMKVCSLVNSSPLKSR